MKRFLLVMAMGLALACGMTPVFAQAPDPSSDARLKWAPSLGATGYKIAANGGALVDVGNVVDHTFFSLARDCSLSTLGVLAYNSAGESAASEITVTARPRIETIDESPQNSSICLVEGSSFATDVTLAINGTVVAGLSRDECTLLSFPCANAPGTDDWVSFNVCNGTVCSDTTPKPGDPVILGVD
jgi:hypothetical protein